MYNVNPRKVSNKYLLKNYLISLRLYRNLKINVSLKLFMS